jgi:hypothetical protein
MAHRKRQKYEDLIAEKDLKHLPLAFRFLIKRETDTIGEMYSYVRFSTSKKLGTCSLNNYTDFTPISGIFISEEEK